MTMLAVKTRNLAQFALSVGVAICLAGVSAQEKKLPEEFWAFQNPVKARIPANPGSEWGRNAVDPFVFSRLRQEGLAPSPAERDQEIGIRFADKRFEIESSRLGVVRITKTVGARNRRR